MMKNYIKIMAGAGICTLMLTGCGSVKVPEVVEHTTLSVDKEGILTSYLVEDFDKAHYDVTALEDMAVKEAAEYNTEHQKGETVPLTVEKVEMLADGKKVLVKHVYSDATVYNDYNVEEFFYGTVAEALNAGYDLTEGLVSIKDGTAMVKEELDKNPDKTYVIVTDAKALIYGPYKVSYISEGAAYQEDGSVDTKQAEGFVTILMK
ncbi:MAG: hypothetical protein IJF07_02785 [Lachnospiraceae bacterium]|nr:hypothetical protein [Lachnospiraceae bacterium]